jgi:hypothetical protein
MKFSNSKSSRWVVITAGLGSQDFENAAKRVEASFKNTNLVDKVVAIRTEQIYKTCPVTTEIYSRYIASKSRGFGFMSWKPELVQSAFKGTWGDFDGVLWIDAGCEVSINPMSTVAFKKFQRYAIANGVAAFTLDTTEIAYTKRDLFEEFPQINPQESGNQIQTTWIFFHGKAGRVVAQSWFELVCKGTNLLDLEPSRNPEYPEFLENRYDQSSFSLVCKSLGIEPMKYRPTAGFGSIASRLRSFTQPIWTSRNRTGGTKRTKIHKFLEIFG